MPNKVTFTIYDCEFCPNATLKYDAGSGQDIMYCKSHIGTIMLREGWGSRLIPDWCPLRGKESSNEKQNSTND